MRHLVNAAVSRGRHWFNRHKTARQRWEAGIASELAFWRRWLRDRGGRWAQDYAFRMDPDAPLQQSIGQWLPAAALAVDILDVGAGPVTSLGKRWPGVEVRIRACDALGEHYATLPFPPGAPPVKTEQCDSERLLQVFAPDQFDIVHARNTLDHSYEPMAAIHAMVAVTRPGGVIILDHAANEARNEGYRGLHQWNFFVAESTLWLENRQTRHDVVAALGPVVDIAHLAPDGSNHAYAVFRKRPRSS